MPEDELDELDELDEEELEDELELLLTTAPELDELLTVVPELDELLTAAPEELELLFSPVPPHADISTAALLISMPLKMRKPVRCTNSLCI